MYERRCCVCGTLLYYTMTNVRLAAAYCPDKPCFLYPAPTTSRAEDPTLPALYTALVMSTPTTAAQLNRSLGKGTAYMQKILERQRERWSRFN